MEYDGEEFEVFGEDQPQAEKTELIEEEKALNIDTNLRPLKEFAEEQDLKMATLRKIIYLLQEQGIVFERTESAILVDPFQERLLLEFLATLRREDANLIQKPLKRRLVIMG